MCLIRALEILENLEQREFFARKSKIFCWQIHYAFWKISQFENSDKN